jgi:hypothetical protein
VISAVSSNSEDELNLFPPLLSQTAVSNFQFRNNDPISVPSSFTPNEAKPKTQQEISKAQESPFRKSQSKLKFLQEEISDGFQNKPNNLIQDESFSDPQNKPNNPNNKLNHSKLPIKTSISPKNPIKSHSTRKNLFKIK